MNEQLKFPAYFLFGFLNYTGWPRTKGLIIRKKVVSSVILWGSLVELVRAGIALGALRPKIAVYLLYDLFSKKVWSGQLAAEMWAQFDPSEKVTNNSDKPPEEVIVGLQSPTDFFNNKSKKFDKVMKDMIGWEFILTDKFSAHYHCIFISGLIWGLIHPKEAVAYHEEKRQRLLNNLPEMLSAGLDVQPPKNLEGFASEYENLVNEYQDVIHPFIEIPKELLSLPIIANRLNSV